MSPFFCQLPPPHFLTSFCSEIPELLFMLIFHFQPFLFSFSLLKLPPSGFSHHHSIKTCQCHPYAPNCVVQSPLCLILSVAQDTVDHSFFLTPFSSCLCLDSLCHLLSLFFLISWPLSVEVLQGSVAGSLLFYALTYSLVFSPSLAALKYLFWESSKWLPNIYFQVRSLPWIPHLQLTTWLILSAWISKSHLKCNVSKK